MSKLLIVFLILWAVILFRSIRRGFIRTILSFILFIVFIVGVKYLTPVTNQTMSESSNMQSWAQEKCEDYVRGQLEKKSSEATIAFAGILGVENTDGLGTTESIINQLLTSDETVTMIASKLTPFLIWLVSLLLTAVILLAALIIFSILISRAVRRSAFAGIDKVLGVVPGILKCLLWAWIVLLIIRIASLFGLANNVTADIESSQILTFLYKNNPLTEMAIKTIENLIGQGLSGILK